MGPLQGVKVVEFQGIGPGPFCAMMLADMGAEVIQIDRPPAARDGGDDANWRDAGRFQFVNRGRRALALDLKLAAGREVALRLIRGADVLVEGFRPGVMERLGLGPEPCLSANPRLVYGRMTGWGQDGPLAQAAGHDINYIALSGALHAGGRRGQPPAAAPTLIGDIGGGAMMLAFGIVCALLEVRRSGRGQVIDAAVCDGSALLCSLLYSLHAAGMLSNDTGTNFFDTGSHFYDAYECADGHYISVGALEGRFYAKLLGHLGIDDADPAAQFDQSRWPAMKERIAAVFRSRSRDEWCALLEGSDCCFAPVLDFDEAPRHAHNRARGNFIEIDGVRQPAPAPKFSRTPAQATRPPAPAGADTESVLAEYGYSAADISSLRDAGVIV
ncbi:MAG: CoA transferase [Gammaproteobacteria bacterium]|nr:CoA transferase [Gammaproteobacteria bacterium]